MPVFLFLVSCRPATVTRALDRLEDKITGIEDQAVAQLELNQDTFSSQLDEVTFDSGVEAEFLALKNEAGLIEDKTSASAATNADTSAGAADEEFEKLKAELKN